MNEKEELLTAKKELISSIKAVGRNLKIYGVAQINHKKAIVKNVGNNIINAFEQLQAQIEIDRYNKELAKAEKAREKAIRRAERLEEENRLAMIRERTKDHKKGMEEALAEEEKQAKKQNRGGYFSTPRNEEKSENQNRFLNFKQGANQKTNSFLSKLKNVKNNILKTLSPSNIDVKIRNAFDKAGIWGLKVANSTLGVLNTAKDNVTAFTSEQIQKYQVWKANKELEKREKERQASIERAESIEKANEEDRINEHTIDHKSGMEETFSRVNEEVNNAAHSKEKEQPSKPINEVKENKKIDVNMFDVKETTINKNRIINFKPETIQKTNSFFSKVGKVKNSLLNTLTSDNIDVKIRNAFDKAGIWGLKVANSTLGALNTAKDNVTAFTSEQIQKYQVWKANKELEKREKERQASIERAEFIEKANEEARIKSRTADHKKGMKEALNKQERDEYDAKHEEYQKEKERLIASLKADRNRLLNIASQPVVTNEEPLEESRSRSR